jgi:phage anti-repressor protein
MSLDNAIITYKGASLISGRDIWQGLGIGKDFSNWMKDRIQNRKLIEGKHFSPILAKTSNPQGGRSKKEYYFTSEIGIALAASEGTTKSWEFAVSLIERLKTFHKNETKQLTINYALSRTNDKSILKQENDSLKKENDHLVSIISKKNKKPNKKNNHIGYTMKNVFESIM